MSAWHPDEHKEDIKDPRSDCASAALREGIKSKSISPPVFKGVVPIDAMSEFVDGAAQHDLESAGAQGNRIPPCAFTPGIPGVVSVAVGAAG